MTKVKVVRVDPYHKTYGLLVPEIVQKFMDTLAQFGDETGNVAMNVFPRLFAKDPGTLLLAAVDPSVGKVKGFTAAITTPDGMCVMLQPRLDESTENDAVAEMIEHVEDWAKALGYNELTLISRRADPKWIKKHGFEVSRYIMTKSLVEDEGD